MTGKKHWKDLPGIYSATSQIKTSFQQRENKLSRSLDCMESRNLQVFTPYKRSTINDLDCLKTKCLTPPVPLRGTPSVPLRGRRLTRCGEIDLELYNDDIERHSMESKVNNNENASQPIAFLRCVFKYIRDENVILAELRDFIVNIKPTLINDVILERTYKVMLEMKYLSSPKPTTNLTDAKNGFELTLGTTRNIPLKHKYYDVVNMRHVMYDCEKHNKRLALAHIDISVLDVIKSFETFELQEGFLQGCESGLKQGQVSGSIHCDVKNSSLHVKILSCTLEKLSKKEMFVKVSIFTGAEENNKKRTQAIQSATKQLGFLEKLSFQANLLEVDAISILIQLFEKNLLKNELVGATIIGPSMWPPSSGPSCWEKMLTKPYREVPFDDLTVRK